MTESQIQSNTSTKPRVTGYPYPQSPEPVLLREYEAMQKISNECKMFQLASRCFLETAPNPDGVTIIYNFKNAETPDMLVSNLEDTCYKFYVSFFITHIRTYILRIECVCLSFLEQLRSIRSDYTILYLISMSVSV